MLILDINDVEITLSRGGEVLYREPGVAYVDGGDIVFGGNALARSRLHPRQSHNEFWQRLNADPVTPPGDAVENQADLVYLHLDAIRATADIEHGAELIIAAPATATTTQLAMLLGIVAEAGFKVRAIVDAAVAAACLQPLEGRCRVLDVALHRGIVTQLEIGEAQTGDTPQLRRAAVDEVPATGFAALVEGWVDTVADHFVDSTRFDPLRIAATEQQVFDQVVAGIDADDAEFVIHVEHDNVSRRVSVARRSFAAKSEQRYSLLAQALGAMGAPGPVAITHRARKLPGLAAFLRAAGHEVVPLAANAVASAALEHATHIVPAAATDSEAAGARLIAALPISRARSPASRRLPPTHLLCGAIALPLAADTDASTHPASGAAPSFHVKCRDGRVSVAPAAAGVLLNGNPVTSEQPANTGDAIAWGNIEFRLIAVIDG